MKIGLTIGIVLLGFGLILIFGDFLNPKQSIAEISTPIQMDNGESMGHSEQTSSESSVVEEEHDHSAHDHGEAEPDEHDHNAGASMKTGHLSTFGPEEAPHMHALDYSEFKKVSDIAKAPYDLPPPLERDYETTVVVNLHSTEVISEIAPGISYHFWTFNDTVPGPLLRVREGDTVILTLSNDKTSSHKHSIDLHAVTGPGGGAVATQVAPGESKTIQFKAINPGVFVYHCATTNVPMHMTNGMYGLIIVEPKEGFPKVDKEFYVMQGEIYTEGAIGEKGFQKFDPKKMLYENPEYVVFNGRVKGLVDHILKASVGDKVRLYVGNGGVSFISSFHVIGEIFDTVYPEAATSPLKKNVQTTLIPAGGAVITEFEMEVPGNYILVDHSLARLDKGAWGILNAEGPENPAVYIGKP
jgi:nitrite reductase (NO-forming)